MIEDCSSQRDNAIQSVSRSLATLQGLNLNNGASALQLARFLHLPRATVYRILETLAGEGYVRKDQHTGGYWLEEKVLDLGSGFRKQDWILDDAEQVITEIYNELHWCVMLCAPKDNEMMIRVATLKRNLQGGQRSIAGRTMAMSSGPGLTFMAFCTDEKRDELLDHIDANPIEGEGYHRDYFRDRGQVLAKLQTIREQGFHAYVKMSRARSLSVPVLHEHQAVGTLNITFFAPNASQDDLIKSYLGRLRVAADRLGHSAANMRDTPASSALQIREHSCAHAPLNHAH